MIDILEKIKKDGKATFECDNTDEVIKILELFDISKKIVTISYHKIIIEEKEL